MKNVAIVLLVSFCYTVCFAGYKTYLSLTHPCKFQTDIVECSKLYDLDPALVASVINVESGYNKKAVSNKGAVGLMQIKFSTANYMNNLYGGKTNLTENDLFDASTNINYGCLYLKYLTTKFKNTFTALAAYNAGETIVRVWLNDENYSTDKTTLNKIPFLETENYVKKIKNNLKFYNKIY